MNIDKITQNTNKQSNLKFKATENLLAEALPKNEKLYYGFIKQRENLSTSRFVQDVTTNWIPKVVFTRSIADFTEMSFLEYTESALFYFVPMILSNLFGKAFSSFSPEKLRNDVSNHIAKPTEELLKSDNLANKNIIKRATSAKAAIVLACVAIPAAEYGLSFAKNLLTLKVFKKSDFNNVVNLNKDEQQIESKEHQERVKKSAFRHIKVATGISAASLAGGVVLAGFGHKSETLQKISRGILRPGEIISQLLGKVGVKDKDKNINKELNKYINFDCDVKDGKPVLSKGQLVVSTVAGFFGYSAAGKDRGKLDQLEVWTRVPIVVLYTIFGSEVFDWAFKHLLLNNNKFPDLIKRNKETHKVESVPDSKDLEKLAEELSKTKNTSVQNEFKRLVKEKAIISAAPYAFSLVFMGFLLAGITRFWTQYRYNHSVGQNSTNKPEATTK